MPSLLSARCVRHQVGNVVLTSLNHLFAFAVTKLQSYVCPSDGMHALFSNLTFLDYAEKLFLFFA